MKFIGKFQRKRATPNGIELTFQVDHIQLATIEELKPQEYAIEVKKPYKKRSLNQNSYLWALINEICMEEDGDISGANDKYIQLLQMAGAKSVILEMPKDAVSDFEKVFRTIKVLDERQDGETIKATVQAFYGSSTFDTKEMTQLVDTTIRYASEIGIETDYWESLLKGES